MKLTSKKNKGITLVALVITIVILLILAGISIAQLTGNGLFDKVQLAKQRTQEAQEKENSILKEYEEYMKNNGDLPENTQDTEAGKQVRLPEQWQGAELKYVDTETGEEKVVGRVAAVYAVSLGGGETVPVPNGFYYVGGNLSTGVIISDNQADKYDGTDKTTWEKATELQGNQFVWIPCTEQEYVKNTTWNKQNAQWDTTTSNAELVQIRKYGGFYVARYEAGLATDIEEFTTKQQHTGSNKIYNQDGVPQSKAGQIPWMFIDWNYAKKNAESMYNTDSVQSGLITGTQWDVMITKIKEKENMTDADLTSSGNWGNYRNTQIDYNGRLAKATYTGGYWYLDKFGEKTTGKTANYSTDNSGGDLLTTGASNYTHKYHTFDVAGNLWEWTEEDSHYQTSNQYRVIRGGSYIYAYATYPVCYRYGHCTVSISGLDIGYRAVLYIK